MILYIESENFVGYAHLNLFPSELEHFVSNFQKNDEITKKLIEFCVDADVGIAPTFETVAQNPDFELYIYEDGLGLCNDEGNTFFSKRFNEISKRITFYYEDKKGKTGRRMVDVSEEDDTYIRGIDSDKGEYRQFLKNRMSRVALVK